MISGLSIRPMRKESAALRDFHVGIPTFDTSNDAREDAARGGSVRDWLTGCRDSCASQPLQMGACAPVQEVHPAEVRTIGVVRWGNAQGILRIWHTRSRSWSSVKGLRRKCTSSTSSP